VAVETNIPYAHKFSPYYQHLALAAGTAAVLIFGSRRFDHRTHPRFAALIGQQPAQQRLAVNPIGLCTTWLSIPSFCNTR
jgi:hypothetical protein